MKFFNIDEILPKILQLKYSPQSFVFVNNSAVSKMATCTVVNVQCPNGRRQKVKLTAHMTLLQVKYAKYISDRYDRCSPEILSR